MVTDKELSVRQACKTVDLPRSVYRYRKVPKDDSALMEALEELVKSIRQSAFGSATTGFGEKDMNAFISGFTGCTYC
jgi:hypothetical protein